MTDFGQQHRGPCRRCQRLTDLLPNEPICYQCAFPPHLSAGVPYQEIPGGAPWVRWALLLAGVITVLVLWTMLLDASFNEAMPKQPAAQAAQPERNR